MCLTFVNAVAFVAASRLRNWKSTKYEASTLHKKQVHKIMERQNCREPRLGLDDLDDQQSEVKLQLRGPDRVLQGSLLAVSDASGFGLVGTGGRLSLFSVVNIVDRSSITMGRTSGKG